MSDAIVTHGLTKYYGSYCAVNQLNLRIPEGMVYGLLGRNGAGKTTTIKMLLGLLHPSYGHAEVLGEDTEELRPETRARIAYLAEDHPLYRWMTIGQAIRFTRAFYSRWNQGLLDQILDHFQLSYKKKIRRLSRGQRAQVALALVVASDPEVLILDDPTLGLDTVVRRDFLESLIQIIQRRGRTILFSSHILGDVERVADRIGIIVDGVLRVDCPTDHFKKAVRKVVLDFPGTPPELPPCPRLISSRQVGHRLEVLVVDMDEEHHRIFDSLHADRVEDIGFNLEDAFIEYTSGPRRGLPVFATEDAKEGKANV
ncbi:MAG: ABC transporter ATP-binding protein [Planctomycetia bacterium]|jgi:ABC-2 type transport system ATP-binding protein